MDGGASIGHTPYIASFGFGQLLTLALAPALYLEMRSKHREDREKR